MPTITVDRAQLHDFLSRDLTFDELNDILFDYGLELESSEGENEYRIEVPANRYDLLCVQGLCTALNSYLDGTSPPELVIDPRVFDVIYHHNVLPVDPKNAFECPQNDDTGNIQYGYAINPARTPNTPQISKDKSTSRSRPGVKNLDCEYHSAGNVTLTQGMENYSPKGDSDALKSTDYATRPYIACAVIHDIDLSPEIYKNFIDYQEKLSGTLGRNRSLVAIGTHDFDKIEFPVFYTRKNRSEILFRPLNQSSKMSLEEILDFYGRDPKMKGYAKLVDDNCYVFTNANGQILSLPPLINSDLSKVTLDTRNIFVEVTGMDFGKVHQALASILQNFRGKSVSFVNICMEDQRREIRENIRKLIPPHALSSLYDDSQNNKDNGIAVSDSDSPKVCEIYNESGKGTICSGDSSNHVCNIYSGDNSVEIQNKTVETSDTEPLKTEGTRCNGLILQNNARMVISDPDSRRCPDLSGTLKNLHIGEKDFQYTTPCMHPVSHTLELDYLNKKLGLCLKASEVIVYLKKMMHSASALENTLIIKTPFFRTDILHIADIIDDIAVAYGFNNFTKVSIPFHYNTNELFMTKFINALKIELTQCGYNEVLTLSLLSKKEMNISPITNTITLNNFKSGECESIRSSLLPGLLKCASSNQHSIIPFQIFEISDCCYNSENLIYNRTKLGLAYIGKIDKLDNVIGICSMILRKVGISDFKYVENDNHKLFFAKRGADILINDSVIGVLGVVDPNICIEYRLNLAVSCFEIDIDLLCDLYRSRSSSN